MKLHRHLPVIGRLYHQRDRARMERDAAIRQNQSVRGMFGSWTMANHLDLQLLLDTTNVLDRNIVNLGDFENAQCEYLCGVAKKLVEADENPIFLDVGSNWGLYSMLMAKTGVETVIAFEPDARNLAHMRANYILNNLLEAITVKEVAVWHETTDIEFAGTAENEGRDRGWAQVVSEETPAIEGGKTLTTVTLPAVSLDDDMPDVTDCAIIMKIDTEGAEQQVLQGAKNLLESNAVLLQVENHLKNRKGFLSNLPKGFEVVHTIEPDVYLANAAMRELMGV